MMSKTNLYTRPMVSERQFLYLPNSTIVITVELKGKVTEKQLEAAVKNATIKHPLLASRIKIDESKNSFFTNEDVASIEVQSNPLSNGTSWTESALSEIQKFVNKQKGPLIRFILQKTNENTFIIISCDHSICDGISLCILIKDLLNYLAYPESPVESLFLPPPLHKILPKVAKGNFLFRFLINRMNKKWKKKNITFSNNDYQKLHNLFWQKNKRNLITWFFSRELTSNLIAKAHNHKITLNSFINTAFLAAQKEVQGNSKDYSKNIVVPVNLRPYLTEPVENSFGYYAGAIRLELEYSENKPFWENAKEIHQQIKTKLKKNKFFDGQKITYFSPTFIDAFPFTKYSLLNDSQVTKLVSKMGIDRINVGLAVSNLGKLDFSTHTSTFELQHVFGPITISDTIEKYVGVVTCNGSLCFTFSVIEALSIDTMLQIRDSVNKHFLTAIQQS